MKRLLVLGTIVAVALVMLAGGIIAQQAGQGAGGQGRGGGAGLGPIGTIDEAFLLEKPNEHQAIQDYRGIPAPLALVGNTVYLFEKCAMNILKPLEECFCNYLYIEGRTNAIRRFGDWQVSFFIELGEIDNKS